MKSTVKTIKLIATDLDGTLLDYQMNLPPDNKTALERAAALNLTVVVATGRSYGSIPDHVKEIEGIRYLVTSNGAQTYDFATGELLMSIYIREDVIDSVWDILHKKDIMLEVFVDGKPYVHNWDYVNPQIYRTTEAYIKYFMASRKPVADIFTFIEEHKGEIENINLVFRHPEERLQTLSQLEKIQGLARNFSLTSSFPFNLEIGGLNVDKANAIEKICKLCHIKNDETMCIGDNLNDISMVKFAGVGVAMENAEPDVKAAADFVTKSNSESGVAFAVEKFVFNQS